MDKNTLSNYGWIVIAVLVLSVMIALATPFGEYIKAGVESTTAGLFDTSEKALNIVGMSATGKEPVKPIVNVRDEYEHLVGYLNSSGDICNDTGGRYIRVPVNEGETWVVWYEKESHLSSGAGALRFENSAQEKVSHLNMYDEPRYSIDSSNDVLGAAIKIPSGVSYICVNLKLGSTYDYTQSAIIAKINPTIKWVAFGDSITEFDIRASKNYVELLSNQLSMPVVNLGVGGSGYLKKGGFSQKFSSIPSDVELVTFYGSLNDLDSGAIVGTATDVYVEGANNSLAACMNNAFDYIQNNYPNAKLVVISPAPWHTTNPAETNSVATKYVSVMQEICESKEIPFLDLFHNSGMTPWDNDYKAQYYTNADGIHPNNEGHKILASKITPFLQSVLNG